SFCRYDKCHCLADVPVDRDDSDDVGGGKHLVCAYQATGKRAGMLSARMLHEDCDAVIYECHEGCACSAECPNRVVERGRRVPLQIFRTKNRGWGALVVFILSVPTVPTHPDTMCGRQ